MHDIKSGLKILNVQHRIHMVMVIFSTEKKTAEIHYCFQEYVLKMSK
jgi:hypothetical protein